MMYRKPKKFNQDQASLMYETLVALGLAANYQNEGKSAATDREIIEGFEGMCFDTLASVLGDGVPPKTLESQIINYDEVQS